MISVITITNRPEFLDNVFENYERQVFKKKELIIVLNSDSMNIEEWKKRAENYLKVSVFQLPEQVSLGACTNFAAKKTKHNYIAKMDDDDYYAPYYLTDTMDAFNKTDADIVGKATTFCYFESSKALVIRDPGKENKFVKGVVKGATLAFKKKVFNTVKFPNISTREDTLFMRKARKKGFKIYSTHKYNHTYCRRDFKDHASLVTDEKILKKSKLVSYTDDFKTPVQKVPNN
ncbi:glycosyltransferase [Metabacillus halosaccharovorans]|uniref:glycosyltransferase n=1 Tax=Metabacillus halosaccharovorans TaxID=930124 RepID=UPI00203E51DB|nr:glycosyltransferase [Metabacillus halosaccharovorans]MCM3439699.1 glycosyltransferase family 2 protein [Metabacillus halosaccharovorans]